VINVMRFLTRNKMIAQIVSTKS